MSTAADTHPDRAGDRCWARGAVDSQMVQAAAREALGLLTEARQRTVEALRLLGDVDGCGLAELWGYTSTERLVAHSVGMANRDSAELLRVARHLARHRATADALAEGAITLGQAGALARAAVGFDAAYEEWESRWLGACVGRDVDELERLVRQWRARLDGERTAADAEHTFATRGLWAQQRFDGSCTGRFRLDPVGAEVMFTALETQPDPVSTLTEPRTLAQRRADKLIDICHHSLTTPHPDHADPNDNGTDDADVSSRHDHNGDPSSDTGPDRDDTGPVNPGHHDDDSDGDTSPAGRDDSGVENAPGRRDDSGMEIVPGCHEDSGVETVPGYDGGEITLGRPGKLAGAVRGELSSCTRCGVEPTGRGGAGVSVDVIIDVETLAGHAPSDLERLRSELPYGGPIAGPGLDRLLCDASYRALITDGPRTILAYTQATQDITPGLKRAIRRRDRHCQFTGCDRPWNWCDLHHITPRNQGGPTEHQNLVLLCRFHHTCIHEGGWQLSRAPNGTITVTSA